MNDLASGFSFAGHDDRLLPRGSACEGDNGSHSGMGHLWYAETGNTAGAASHRGNFQGWRCIESGSIQAPACAAGPAGNARRHWP